MKPPISYYGGKQAIINHILPLIPYHEVYTEVFFGGGTVFFSKEPAVNETINDRLDIVINFYKVLKNNYKALKKLIDESLLSKTTHTHALKVIQNKTPSDKTLLAWAFWYTCNFSYLNKIGGGIKYSNHQSITPPQALKRKKELFTELLVYRIENAHIENRDALWILNSRNVVKAFHYEDPPYIGADMGHYKGYTMEEYINLLDWNSNKCKGKFILSNYRSEILTKYIHENNWNFKEIKIRLKNPRKSGPEKVEVLVWNFNHYNEHPELFNII